MQLIFDTAGFVAQWVQMRVGYPFRGHPISFGFIKADRLVAGVVLHDWTESSVTVAIASDDPHWCRRVHLARMFGYVFRETKRRRITGFVHASNARSLKFGKGMDFVEEGRLRQAAPDGGDVIVLGLLESDCRFLKDAGDVEEEPAQRS